MYELGGTSAEQELNNTAVRLKSFPYPPYLDDKFAAVLQGFLPVIVMLSFIVTAPVICKDVVLEKEKKLKVGVHYRLYALIGSECFYLTLSVWLSLLLYLSVWSGRPIT